MHDLAVQPQLADHLDDGRSMLAINGQQHLTAPVGHPATSERIAEPAIHRHRVGLSLAVDDGRRPVFEHQRIDMLGDLRELGLQLGADAAGDQHNHQTVAPNLIDSIQRVRRDFPA